MTTYRHDVLIIGSGAAGLTVALNLPSTCRVALLSKGQLTSASTWYAQGGIAAVLDETDSMESHIADTHVAGADICHDDAVRKTVENGPEAIRWLIEQGVDFTRFDGSDPNEQGYHLTREGGHSHRRIIHASDATGIAISSALIRQVEQRSNVERFEHRVAVDLLSESVNGQRRCSGAYIHNINSGTTDVFLARFVVLATGDGVAMAWRAGCRVANMEFMQFHPTCLYHPKAKSFLITEAIRGEGGHLLLPDGERFMHRFDERGELAPRDIVARAIDHEMKRLGADCLYLDISHRPADFIINHFPTVYAKCLQLGIDITRDPIPVVPAAHYTCGGVITDLDGQTDLAGLYAIGETSFTGLHGANRMASNSLLECFVFGRAASDHIKAHMDTVKDPEAVSEWDESMVTEADEDVVIAHNWDELRRFMWDYVGIVRTVKRLQRASHRVELLKREITEYYSNYQISNDLLELRNLTVIAELIIRSALMRKESRGLHYMLDFPERADNSGDTILVPDNFSSERHKGH